jgi:hypothetical protein
MPSNLAMAFERYTIRRLMVIPRKYGINLRTTFCRNPEIKKNAVIGTIIVKDDGLTPIENSTTQNPTIN